MSLSWSPAGLSFTVAIGKVSVQQLRASNASSSTAYTFKVKTTNPKRYCVRPNVGIVWPGQEATVTVQLPAMKEYPADMNKCKDKFQVLSLALATDRAEELQAADTESCRAALTELWASEAAKEATVDKIRCSMTFDSTFRNAPITEEDHPIPPYSPETVSGPPEASGPMTPAAQTPFAERVVEASPTDGAQGDGGAPSASNVSGPKPSKSPGASKTLDTALEAVELRERLAAAEAANGELRAAADRKAQEVAGKLADLTSQLDARRKQLASLERAASSERNGASSSDAGSSSRGGVKPLTVLLLLLGAFVSGYGVGGRSAAPVSTLPAKVSVSQPPTGRLSDEL